MEIKVDERAFVFGTTSVTYATQSISIDNEVIEWFEASQVCLDGITPFIP